MLAGAHISSLNYLRLNHILKFKVNVPLCSLIVLCSHFFSSYFPTMILSPLIYKRHFELFIFALDNNDLKSFKRCVLETIFIFISRLIAMAITLVTLEQNISHQLKSFILSPAKTHFPLKTYRRSVIIFKITLELRHYPIYRKSVKGLNPGVISKVDWVWSCRWT